MSLISLCYFLLSSLLKKRKIGRHKRPRINKCPLAQILKRAVTGQCTLPRHSPSCQESPPLLKVSGAEKQQHVPVRGKLLQRCSPRAPWPPEPSEARERPRVRWCVLWLNAQLYFPKASVRYFSQTLRSHILNSYVDMGRRNRKKVLISCRRF